jgi:putative oxidoreductase
VILKRVKSSMSNLIDFVGRLFISALFLLSAYNKILSIDGTMSWMEGFGISGLLLYPTIALEIILPLFIIIGYNARLSAGLLAAFCIATAFIFHFDFNDQMQLIAFLKNIGLAGGFLFILANGVKDWSINNKKKYVRL